MQGWLSDLAGRTKDLIDEVNSADLVVMVATAGENCAGRLADRRGLQPQAGDDHRPRRRQRRGIGRSAVEDAGAAAALCADAGDREREDYVADMLAALRA